VAVPINLRDNTVTDETHLAGTGDKPVSSFVADVHL
jgi:hypothetical protein